MALNGELGTLFYKLVLGEDDFNKSLDNADKKIDAFNKKLEKIGKELTTKLTLPILAVGTASLKFAADAEVATKKFDTAFKGSIKEATEAVAVLNKEYGISNTESTRLLANTGDLLKGFGATSDEALSTSLEVQKLAAALGAYNGIPTAEASEKITKALLGQTEGLVTLGVKLSQTDIEQELVRRGQEKLTGQALLQAKAQATLTLAMGQSSDAISSVAKNQGTMAFQTQALLGDMKDLSVQIGNQLLPIAKQLVGGVRDVVGWFSELSESSKKTIVLVAGIVAGIGPLVAGIGAVSTALTFLAANPVGAAIAAVAALTLGIVALTTALNERSIKDAGKRFGELAENIGVTGDQIVQIEKSLKGWNRVNVDGVEEWSEKLGITKEQFLQVAIASGKVSDRYKESARVLLEQLTTERLLKEETEAKAEAALQAAKAQKEAAIAAQAAARAAEDEAKARGEAKYLEGRERIVAIINNSLSEQVRIQKEISSLEELRWVTGSRLENDRLKAVQLLKDEITKLNEEQAKAEADLAAREIKIAQDKADAIIREEEKAKAKRLEFITETLNATKDYGKTELQILQEKYDTIAALDLTLEDEKAAQAQALIALERQISDETIRINEETEKEKDRLRKEEIAKEKAATQAKIAAAQDWANKALQIASSITQIYRNLADTAIRAWDDQIAATNRHYDNAIAKAEAEADADGVRTEEEKKNIIDLKNAQLKAEYDAEMQKFKIEKDAFKRSQAIAYAEIAIQTALAIVKGYAQLGPIKGTIAAVLLAAMGITQAAVVYSRPQPQAPAAPAYLAQGGVVGATPGGINAVIGEGSYDELVAPLNDKTFSQLGKAIVESMTGSSVGSAVAGGLMNLTIVIDGMGQVALQLTQDALNNGTIHVPARVITQG